MTKFRYNNCNRLLEAVISHVTQLPNFCSESILKTILAVNCFFKKLRRRWFISSHLRCSVKSCSYKFRKIQRKTPVSESLFFSPETLLKKRLWPRCFPRNFVKFLRTPFFIEHLWWLLLMIKMVLNASLL